MLKLRAPAPNKESPMFKPLFCYSAIFVGLTGCATDLPEYRDWSYEYASKAHSGTVLVTEHTNVPTGQCHDKWRDENPYQPSGVNQTVGFRLEVQIHDQSDETFGEVIAVELPSNQGKDVVIRDFQRTRSLMLSPDSNGIVKQGDLFFFPEGYFLRAAQPKFEGQNLTFCLGVDHTYLPEAELSSVDPKIRMDRLNIRFVGEPGEELEYAAGTVKLTVRAVIL